jgi:hypothetical protein
MTFSPLISSLGWALPVAFFTALIVWLVFVVIAFRRYRGLGAWTLLGAPVPSSRPWLFSCLR